MSTRPIGVSGVVSYNHNLLDDEYLNTLRFPNGSKIYDEMRRSDPMIKAVWESVQLPLLSCDYIIEPASDSPKDKEVAEFVERNLFPGKYKLKAKKGYKFNKSWAETLQEITLMLPFGFSVMEKIWMTRDGKTYLDKLALRPALTIKDFVFKSQEREELEYVKQTVNGIEKHIPASKLVIFTFQQEGNNLSGIPLLRAMYKPWSIKQDLEKIRAMMFEKYGLGVPIAKTNLMKGTPAYNDLVEALENYGLNQAAYLITNSDTEIDLKTSGTGTAPDMDAAITYYDNQIAVSGLAQFLNLGTTASGNRALGESFVDFFYDFVEGIQNYISGKLNNEVVQELVDYNFDVSEYPVIKAVPPEELPLDKLVNLVNAKILTNNRDLENRVRREIGVAEITEEAIATQKETPKEPTEDEPETEKSDEKPEEEEKEVKASEHNHIELSEFPYTFINLAEMEQELDASLGTTTNEMLSYRDKQAAAIIAAIVAGKKPQNIIVPYKKEQYEYLMDVYNKQVKEGQRQAKAEFDNQGGSVPESLGKDTRKNRLDIIEDDISIRVEGAADKLKTMILEEMSNLQRTGISKGEMAASLAAYAAGISAVTWSAMAAIPVNVGWGDGRAIFAEQFKDALGIEIYSAVLDKNLCSECDPFDGRTQLPGENKFQTPNPRCLGGSNCRCVTILVIK